MIDAQGNYVPDVTPVTTTNTVAPPVTTNIPIPTPGQIYSATNIAQATNAPVAAPDLSNASAIYNYYLNGADVIGARTTAEADAAALATAKATARNRQLAIEGNPLESQQFIVGAQSRAGQLDNAALNALADTAAVSSANYASAKQTASEKANVALSQRSELVSMINQNPKAGITFNDTVVSASKKVSDYMDKVEKDAEKKADEKYAKDLKATLISLGISNKNSKGGTMGVKSMEKALATKYKSKSDLQDKLDDLKLKSAQLDLKNSGGASLSKLTNLLTVAANMPDGGRQFALDNAKKYGVDRASVDSATNPNTDWGKSYRASSTDKNVKTYDPATGKEVKYDENGRPYIEE